MDSPSTIEAKDASRRTEAEKAYLRLHWAWQKRNRRRERERGETPAGSPATSGTAKRTREQPPSVRTNVEEPLIGLIRLYGGREVLNGLSRAYLAAIRDEPSAHAREQLLLEAGAITRALAMIESMQKSA